MLRLAGEAADGVILGSLASPPLIAKALRHVEAGAGQAGRTRRDLEVVSWLGAAISVDRTRATEAVSRYVAVAILTSRALLPELRENLPTGLRATVEAHSWVRTPALVEAMRPLLTDELIDMFSLVGSPQACAARVRALAEVGVDQLSVLLVPPEGSTHEEQMEAWAEALSSTALRGAGQ